MLLAGALSDAYLEIHDNPVGPDPFMPQRFNRYAYVENNPLVLVDLTGEDGFNALSDEEQSTVRDIAKILEARVGLNGAETVLTRDGGMRRSLFGAQVTDWDINYVYEREGNELYQSDSWETHGNARPAFSAQVVIPNGGLDPADSFHVAMLFRAVVAHQLRQDGTSVTEANREAGLRVFDAAGRLQLNEQQLRAWYDLLTDQNLYDVTNKTSIIDTGHQLKLIRRFKRARLRLRMQESQRQCGPEAEYGGPCE